MYMLSLQNIHTLSEEKVIGWLIWSKLFKVPSYSSRSRSCKQTFSGRFYCIIPFFLLQIYSWILDAANTHKDLVTVFNVTKSYEGRPLMGIKVFNVHYI